MINKKKKVEKKKVEEKIKKVSKKLKMKEVNEERVENIISAKFLIEEIKMKKDLAWRLKLIVKKIIPKSFYDYSVKMDFDDSPYDNMVKEVETRIEVRKNVNTLFDDETKKEIKEMEGEIEDIEVERKEKKDQCETINFYAQVEEIKYKDGNTSVVIKVPDSIIEAVNKNKTMIGYYKIDLMPFDLDEKTL